MYRKSLYALSIIQCDGDGTPSFSRAWNSTTLSDSGILQQNTVCILPSSTLYLISLKDIGAALDFIDIITKRDVSTFVFKLVIPAHDMHHARPILHLGYIFANRQSTGYDFSTRTLQQSLRSQGAFPHLPPTALQDIHIRVPYPSPIVLCPLSRRRPNT